MFFPKFIVRLENILLLIQINDNGAANLIGRLWVNYIKQASPFPYAITIYIVFNAFINESIISREISGISG